MQNDLLLTSFASSNARINLSHPLHNISVNWEAYNQLLLNSIPSTSPFNQMHATLYPIYQNLFLQPHKAFFIQGNSLHPFGQLHTATVSHLSTSKQGCTNNKFLQVPTKEVTNEMASRHPSKNQVVVPT